MPNQNQNKTEHFQGLGPIIVSGKHKLTIAQNNKNPQSCWLNSLNYHCFLKTDKLQDMKFCLISGNNKIR